MTKCQYSLCFEGVVFPVMIETMIVLGLESSCDETAVGIVEIDADQNCTLLANIVATSLDLHKLYGGVVPEIAARSHIESVIGVVEGALVQAFKGISEQGAVSKEGGRQDAHSPFDPWSRIDAIAVTYGGGLGGSLLVGVMTARTLAIVKKKPLYAINHVEAHVYANFLTGVENEERRTKNEEEKGVRTEDRRSKIEDGSPSVSSLQPTATNYTLPSSAPRFPMLALIVSGKHSQLALFRDHFDYDLLGWTRDDAVGEAYDKVAKLLGLPYPGGPSVSNAALKGDPHAYIFPKPKVDVENDALNVLRAKSDVPASQGERKRLPSYDFSFSGLKTAVLRKAQSEIGEDFTFPSFKIAERLTEKQKCDIAASFQRTAIEMLVDKTVEACSEFKPKSLVLAGGVAASSELRRMLTERLEGTYEISSDKLRTSEGTEYGEDNQHPVFQYPDIKLCTDNGAMVATLGCFKALLGQPTADPYSLGIAPNLSM